MCLGIFNLHNEEIANICVIKLHIHHCRRLKGNIKMLDKSLNLGLEKS